MFEIIYDVVLKTGLIFLPLFFVGLAGWFTAIDILFFVVNEWIFLRKASVVKEEERGGRLSRGTDLDSRKETGIILGTDLESIVTEKNIVFGL